MDAHFFILGFIVAFVGGFTLAIYGVDNGNIKINGLTKKEIYYTCGM